MEEPQGELCVVLSAEMGRSCSLLLPLLLLLPAGLPSGLALLQYHYDCGDFGMQLLAYPTRGRTVHFKVLGE